MIEELINRLKNDKELFFAYEANIAMAFKDEYSRISKLNNYKRLNKTNVHHIANNAARNFLNALIKTELVEEP